MERTETNAVMQTSPEHKNSILTKLLNETRGQLLNFVTGWIPQYEDAEDIIQDVLYRLIGSIDELRSWEARYAWIYRTARNRIADFYRKRSRSLEGSRSDLRTAYSHESYFLEEVLAEPDALPELNFDRNILRERIEAAIDALPAEQKEVFVLHEIEGLSFRDISRATAVPINTLLSRKRYAVLSLRKQLADLHA